MENPHDTRVIPESSEIHMLSTRFGCSTTVAPGRGRVSPMSDRKSVFILMNIVVQCNSADVVTTAERKNGDGALGFLLHGQGRLFVGGGAVVAR